MSERGRPARPRWLAPPDAEVRKPAWWAPSEGVAPVFSGSDAEGIEPAPFGGEEGADDAAFDAPPAPAIEDKPVSAPPPPPPTPTPPPPPPPPPPPGPDPALVAARHAFAEAAVALATARDEALEIATPVLARLALEMAEAILEDEIRERPELHRALARAALDVVDAEIPARLRASRETYDAIVDRFGSTRMDVGARRVEVVLDPTLEGLGCVVDAAEIRVDGRLRTRLDAARRAFEEQAAFEEHAALEAGAEGRA